MGAVVVGGFGAETLEVSGSDMYEESRSAPVATPPRLFNFGIPPAKIPPNCGGAGTLFVPPPPVSLLLRALFGMDGADAAGGFSMPGIAGALAIGGPADDLDSFPMRGADLSLVTAFFNLAPLVISVRRAPY